MKMTTPKGDCRCEECGICYHDHRGWHHQWVQYRSTGAIVDHPSSLTTPPTDHPSVETDRCSGVECGYQEPHRHGFACDRWCPCKYPSYEDTQKPPILVDTEAAALHAGRTVTVIYRWAREGRLTKHGTAGKGNARWNLREIPAWSGKGEMPPPPPVINKNFQDTLDKRQPSR